MNSRRSKARAVFIDRDGTILNEIGYLADPKALKFYPFVFRALRRLSGWGLKLVVLTNQSGIGRNYFTLKQLALVHKAFQRKLREKGARVQGLYFCPHLPKVGCACRKPRPGMARKAARDLNLDLKRSFVVGDQPRDMGLARRIQAQGVFVLTGKGRRHKAEISKQNVKVTANLDTASRWIIKHLRTEKS